MAARANQPLKIFNISLSDAYGRGCSLRTFSVAGSGVGLSVGWVVWYWRAVVGRADRAYLSLGYVPPAGIPRLKLRDIQLLGGFSVFPRLKSGKLCRGGLRLALCGGRLVVCGAVAVRAWRACRGLVGVLCAFFVCISYAFLVSQWISACAMDFRVCRMTSFLKYGVSGRTHARSHVGCLHLDM